MRNLLFILLTSTLSCQAIAALETGYELGTTQIHLDHNTKTRPNHQFKMGYSEDKKRLGAYLGAEAAYSYTPKIRFEDSETESGYNTHGVKIRAKADIPLTEHFSAQVKGGAGYQKASYFSKSENGTSVESSPSGYFPTTSAGLVVKAQKNLNFSLLANYDGRKGLKRKDNTYFTIGFNYTLPGTKALV